MSFTITGLPRSRTAWLARLFTHGAVRCIHDGYGRFGERLPEVLREAGGFAGVADSGLALVPEKIAPGRVLIVRRDFDDAAESFLAMSRYPFESESGTRSLDVLRRMEAGLKEIAATRECRVVGFGELDDERIVRDAWDWLVGEREPWCAWHWEELRHLRVVVKPETYAWQS